MNSKSTTMSHMPTATALSYRILEKEEWDRLLPIFEDNNGIMPSPELATVAVAEEDGEIVGILVLQVIPHFEPAWASNPRVDFRALTRKLEELLPRNCTVYTSAPNEQIAGLARACGFSDTGWKTMQKTLGEVN
jgi:hypothetical protein